MTSPFGCFACNDLDHWADACPELIPAVTRKEHEARIAKYRQWWWDERITIHQKRKLIEAENERWPPKATERKSA